MAFTVYIAGVQVFPVIDSVALDFQANGRDVASFEVTNTQSYSSVTYGTQEPEAPQVGQNVVVKWGSDVLFAGTIDSVSVDFFGSPTTKGVTQYASQSWGLKWSIQAVDYNQLADRAIVVASYANQTFQQIVIDLLTNYLAVDGVVAGTIPPGPTLETKSFFYQSVAECFNELATFTGYTWDIGPTKILNFTDPLSASPAETLTQSNCTKFVAKRNRAQMRNVQYVVGGRDIAGSQTESFKGNGTDKAYTVSLPIARVPTVTVNAVSKTVGIKQVDTGKDWYWSQDDAVVDQDAGAGALTSSDTLAVTFRGYVPVFVEMEATASIVQRQGFEGGSGRYGAVEKDDSLESLQLAVDKCAGLIRRFSAIPVELEIETNSLQIPTLPSFRTGNIHTCRDSFTIGAIDTFFLDRLRFTETALANGTTMLKAALSLVDTERTESWSEWFGKLARQAKSVPPRQLSLSVTSRSVTGDGATASDSPTVASGGIVSLIGTATVGFSEVV